MTHGVSSQLLACVGLPARPSALSGEARTE
jgi:hypothetical protein